MKVLVCCNVYPPKFVGGAELIAHQQALAIAAAGHEVRVFAGDTHSSRARHTVAEDVHDGLRVTRVRLTAEDFQSSHANFSHPSVEATFAALIAEFRPDVVHFHNLIGLSVGIVAIAREAGARTVMTLHDHWGFCYKNTAMKSEGVPCSDYTACHECQPHVDEDRGRRIPIRLRRDYFSQMLADVDAFVSPSRYLAAAYVRAGHPADRMHVVWNGIAFERFAVIARVADARVRFSFLGHFGRHKGLHTLLQALALLPDRSRVAVNLVGEGEERKAYSRLLEENGCADVVRFWGKLDNSGVADVYAQTDVLVLPSIWRENQPVSITEAMASGCAVIASDAGGVPELVVDGVTGFLVRPGDARSLAERMWRFVDTPGLATAFGHRGRARMRTNTFDAAARRLLSIYEAKRRQARTLPPLVVCFGERADPLVGDTLDALPRYREGRPASVTMSEWLTDTQIAEARVLWVVDPSTEPGRALQMARRHALPLVVPQANDALAAACRAATCGLFYADAEEAAACIAHLLEHDDDRRTLARATLAIAA